MTGMGGGGRGSYFSCMKEGTRVSHAKFQVSMSIRSQTVVFYKILGVGGEGGPPIILLVQKAQESNLTIGIKVIGSPFFPQ